MPEQSKLPGTSPETPVYEIRVGGHLSEEWVNWFEGLTITPEDNGNTLLIGKIADQAALYGVLRRIRDLGLPLISVNRIETNDV